MKIEEYNLRKITDLMILENLNNKLVNNDIQLIKAYTNNLKEIEFNSYLSNYEIKKSRDYKSEVAKINYMTSRAILNVALKNILGKEIKDIKIKRDKNNKPYLENNLKLKFNISHTDGLVLLAFSKKDIGIDVEKIEYKFDFKDILENCFNKDEIININNDSRTFFRFWTTKEAYLKCDGIGLIRNLKEIEIISCGNEFVKIKDNKKNTIHRLKSLTYDETHVGAICLEGK